MGVVRNRTHFKGVAGDGCTADAMTAEQYVDRVFVTERLPATMSTKSFLSIATDLKRSLATALLRQAKVVPRTSVHARSIMFSTSVYTLLTQQELSAGVSEDDALKLVKAASPLLRDHFSFTAVERREIEKVRPRLTRCVRTALSRGEEEEQAPHTSSLCGVCSRGGRGGANHSKTRLPAHLPSGKPVQVHWPQAAQEGSGGGGEWKAGCKRMQTCPGQDNHPR